MKSVAIIDDSASERFVLKGFAEECALKVVSEGANGEEAVRICRENRPDLVIMDVRMPVMDGIEAAGEIARTCPTPVILLTATGDDETIRRALDAGVMAYLSKPIRLEDLKPAIELAHRRFGEFMELKEEVADLKDAIRSRKLVEKAKGLIMEKDGVSEAEAYRRIRKISMDKRKSMMEIASVIILALETEAN